MKLTYRVARGHTWGIDKLPEGSTVELEESEALGFVPWKLVPATVGEGEEGKLVFTAGFAGDVEDEGDALIEVEDEEDGEPWADLSTRTIDLLEANDIFPEDIPTMSDEELRKIPRLGLNTLEEIRARYPKVE